jgi:hypothetical protein
MSFTIKVQYGKKTLRNGKVVPNLTVLDSTVHLPKESVNVRINNGNIISKLAQSVKGLFTNKIIFELEKNMNEAIHRELPKWFDQQMEEHQGIG